MGIFKLHLPASRRKKNAHLPIRMWGSGATMSEQTRKTKCDMHSPEAKALIDEIHVARRGINAGL